MQCQCTAICRSRSSSKTLPLGSLKLFCQGFERKFYSMRASIMKIIFGIIFHKHNIVGHKLIMLPAHCYRSSVRSCVENKVILHSHSFTNKINRRSEVCDKNRIVDVALCTIIGFFNLDVSSVVITAYFQAATRSALTTVFEFDVRNKCLSLYLLSCTGPCLFGYFGYTSENRARTTCIAAPSSSTSNDPVRDCLFEVYTSAPTTLTVDLSPSTPNWCQANLDGRNIDHLGQGVLLIEARRESQPITRVHFIIR